jgi:hypothetical protein
MYALRWWCDEHVNSAPLLTLSPSGTFLSWVISFIFLFSGDFLSVCFRSLRSVLGLVFFRSLCFVCVGGFEGGLGRGGAAVVLLGDCQAVWVWIIKTCLGFFWCSFCEGQELWLGQLALVMFGRWLV